MLIGREQEQEMLHKAYESDSSQFVAVYGRRRVGKTYLVRECFADKFVFNILVLQKQVQNCNCVILRSRY